MSQAEPRLDQGSAESADVDSATWGARFGWLAGGILGLIVGFALTFWIEWRFFGLRAVGSVPRSVVWISRVVIPGGFVSGALAGHAFGARGGPSRYKLLGAVLGVLLVVTAWVFFAVQ